MEIARLSELLIYSPFRVGVPVRLAPVGLGVPVRLPVRLPLIYSPFRVGVPVRLITANWYRMP